ncbi:MAG TPA: MerR family transcriptional regulator [Candidatus Limnocylindria bacterium]
MSEERLPAHAATVAGGAASAARYRIGQAAMRVGVSPSALRVWERQGLIRPARSAAGYRLYSERDLVRLDRIRRMRGERVNAPGIRRILPPGSTHHGTGASPVTGAGRGRRLRALRIQHSLSLREASRLAQISVSFLSALERDESGASVATLQRLTRVYGVTVHELLDRGRSGRRHVRPGQRPVMSLGGVRIEQLAVGASELEPQLFVLGPGSSSEGPYAHDGEEFMFVLSGALTVWVGERSRYRLATGDALTFPSTLAHRWRNRADGETRLLWINTPPTF